MWVRNAGGKKNTPGRESLGMESLFRGYWDGMVGERKREQGKRKKGKRKKERDGELRLQKNCRNRERKEPSQDCLSGQKEIESG